VFRNFFLRYAWTLVFFREVKIGLFSPEVWAIFPQFYSIFEP